MLVAHGCLLQERQTKIESEKFAKICDEEVEKFRRELDADSTEVLKHHQRHMARVIGRQLAAQARKQAATSTRLDPVVEKIEVQFPVGGVAISLYQWFLVLIKYHFSFSFTLTFSFSF